LGYAQNTLTHQSFKDYNLFSTSTQTLDEAIETVATDVQALQINQSVLSNLMDETPMFVRFKVIHNSDTLDIKAQRHEILTDDFIVRNQDDETLTYNPGLYYRGIVNHNRQSKAVFNFFNGSLNGIIAIPGRGNRNIGQLQGNGSYVIYTDSQMIAQPDFECHVSDAEDFNENLPQEDNFDTTSSTKCVRVFYELTNDLYNDNSSSVTLSMNWITSLHNIVASLYSDANIPMALSDVLIWQQSDPFVGDNAEKLGFFRENRIAFNGDLAHLLDSPVTGGVAYINSLCQNFRYAFSGLSASFSQLPTYSWSVKVMAHEMGHSLGSPHTHACFWNGSNTAIDSCGPDNGYSEGCDNGSLPQNGGTIMSYCHLDSVGVNLALGFHPQVANYMDNNVDTKSCLGSDCLNSCMQTVAGINVMQNDFSSFTVSIDDVISDSWDYRIYQQNTFPGAFTTTSNTDIAFNNIQPNTYYIIQVANNCTVGQFGNTIQQIYLSDDDWCSGITFADTGGINNNYSSNERLIKTFYPNTPGQKITLNINDFDLEQGFDFMGIYDGENTESPAFAFSENMTGNNPFLTFFEATNIAGAITVEFTSDQAVNGSGWDITVSCTSLSTEEFSENDIKIYPNPFQDELNLESVLTLDKITVYDLMGKIILQHKLKQNVEHKINMGKLNTGIYLMTIESGNQKLTKNIIKR